MIATSVRLRLAATAALALVALVGLGAQRETREKHLLVSATGKDDAPVKDLAAADVKLREDGVAREILKVAPATGPMQIALLVDDSEIANPIINDLRQALTSFINQILDANSQSTIMLMTFGDRPTTLVPATTSAVTLVKGVERVFARQGAGAYLLQAIDESARTLNKKKQATRPIIVAFDIEDGTEFSNDSHESIENTLKNTNVTLWTVVLQERRGGPPMTPEARERAIVLTDVAVASGGASKALISRQAIPLGLTWAATMLNSQYDVTFSRPEQLIPPKTVELETTRPDVRLTWPHWGLQ